MRTTRTTTKKRAAERVEERLDRAAKVLIGEIRRSARECGVAVKTTYVDTNYRSERRIRGAVVLDLDVSSPSKYDSAQDLSEQIASRAMLHICADEKTAASLSGFLMYKIPQNHVPRQHRDPAAYAELVTGVFMMAPREIKIVFELGVDE